MMLAESQRGLQFPESSKIAVLKVVLDSPLSPEAQVVLVAPCAPFITFGRFTNCDIMWREADLQHLCSGIFPAGFLQSAVHGAAFENNLLV